MYSNQNMNQPRCNVENRTKNCGNCLHSYMQNANWAECFAKQTLKFVLFMFIQLFWWFPCKDSNWKYGLTVIEHIVCKLVKICHKHFEVHQQCVEFHYDIWYREERTHFSKQHTSNFSREWKCAEQKKKTIRNNYRKVIGQRHSRMQNHTIRMAKAVKCLTLWVRVESYQSACMRMRWILAV